LGENAPSSQREVIVFLQRDRKAKNGESYEYWTLMKSVRTARGPRHRPVAYLGKRPGLDPGERAGWEHIADIRVLSASVSKRKTVS